MQLFVGGHSYSVLAYCCWFPHRGVPDINWGSGRCIVRKSVPYTSPFLSPTALRRFLGERLTEAVIKEVELQTPYKVVGSPDADSVLVGRVVDERRRVIGETKNDDARIIGTDLIVTINWYDRRGEALMPESSFAVAPLTFFTASSGDFVPEAGQSLATAHQESIERIARQIVQQIEVRW